MVDERLFEIAFFDGVFSLQTEEFKGEGMFYKVSRLRILNAIL